MPKLGYKLLEERFREKNAIFYPNGCGEAFYNGCVCIDGDDVGWANRSKAFDPATGELVYSVEEQHELRADDRVQIENFKKQLTD